MDEQLDTPEQQNAAWKKQFIETNRQIKEWEADKRLSEWKWRFGFFCQITEVSLLVYIALHLKGG